MNAAAPFLILYPIIYCFEKNARNGFVKIVTGKAGQVFRISRNLTAWQKKSKVKGVADSAH